MIFSCIILILLIIYSTYMNNGLPESISDISYIIPKWLFTILIMLMGVLLMPQILLLIGIKYEWLVFMMILGLWCVSSSPYYKTEEIELHYFGAILCFISILTISFLIKPISLVVWVFYPLCLIKSIKKWWVMFGEMLCFLTLMLAIM